jgi:hypothetical protein
MDQEKRHSGTARRTGTVGLRVVTPQLTGLLPDKYRQGDMLDDKIAILRQPTAKPAG